LRRCSKVGTLIGYCTLEGRKKRGRREQRQGGRREAGESRGREEEERQESLQRQGSSLGVKESLNLHAVGSLGTKASHWPVGLCGNWHQLAGISTINLLAQSTIVDMVSSYSAATNIYTLSMRVQVEKYIYESHM